MRTLLGSGLLLLAASGLVAVPTAASAATACDAPDTTWVGPATADGDRSWSLASNWSDGVPTTTSAVCVPTGTNADPEVAEGTTTTVAAVDASAAGVDVEGSLTVTGTWDAGRIGVHGGELVLSGASVLRDALVADDGHLVVAGTASLAGTAHLQTFDVVPGLLEVTPDGSLTLDEPGGDAQVAGPLVNHGTVRALTGRLDLVGPSPADLPPGTASDGAFVAATDGELMLGGGVLADGALLDGIVAFDVVVPAGVTATAVDTLIWPSATLLSPPPSLTGAGTLDVTDGTVVGGDVGDHVTVRVPAGEQAVVVGNLEDHARLDVLGTATSPNSDLAVLDAAVLEVQDGGTWDTTFVDVTGSSADFRAPLGRAVVDAGGLLLGGGTEGSFVLAAVENHGTVRAEGGDLWLLDSSTAVVDGVLTGGRWEVGAGAGMKFAEDASQGTLVDAITGNAADVVLEGGGSSIHGMTALATNEPTGAVTLGQGATLDLAGPLANDGGLTVGPSATLDVAGDLVNDGNLWLEDGAAVSLTGALVNDGILQVDDATAAVASAQQVQNLGSLLVGGDGHLDLDRTLHNTGLLRLVTGASLTTTRAMRNDGEVLVTGAGATLTAPGGTTNAARIDADPDASLTLVGDLSSTGVTAVPAGATVEVTGAVLNAGKVQVGSTGRLAAATYRQAGTGVLRLGVSPTAGRVVSTGVRDLAGTLVLRPEGGTWPPLGSRRLLVTSDGRATPADAFDTVRAPRRNGLTAEVRYRVNRVLLRVTGT